MRTILLLSLSTSITLAFAGRILLDDRDPTIKYQPENFWLIRGLGAVSCPSCSAQPDVQQAYGNTYHDTSSSASAILDFTGTGFEIFAIVPNAPSALSSYTLSIDGGANTTYQHVGTGTAATQYNYNQTIFSARGLQRGPHTLQLYNTFASPSNLLLDAIAIDDDQTPTAAAQASQASASASATRISQSSQSSLASLASNAAQSSQLSQPSTILSEAASQSSGAALSTSEDAASTPVGAIVGGIVAAVVVLAILAWGIWFLSRRRRRAQMAQRVDLTAGDAFDDKDEAENSEWAQVTPYLPPAPRPNFDTRPSPSISASETLPLSPYTYAGSATNDSQALLSPSTPMSLEKAGYGGSEPSPTTPSGREMYDVSRASAPLEYAMGARVTNPDEEETGVLVQHRDGGSVALGREEIPPTYSDARR